MSEHDLRAKHVRISQLIFEYWPDIQEDLLERIEIAHKDMETVHLDDFRYFQGYIAALRDTIDRPKAMLSKLDKQLKPKGD